MADKTYPLPYSIDEINTIIDNCDGMQAAANEKWNIVTSDTLPEVSSRKEKTLYFKLTDEVRKSSSSMVSSSFGPMGLREV